MAEIKKLLDDAIETEINNVKKVLRTKLGCEVDIQLNEFRTTVIDDKTHVHLDLDADLTKEELNKLLKTIGI